MRPADKRSVLGFLAGVTTVNSIVHLTSAAVGKEHLTPLPGWRSSPAANGVWGAANLVGGLALARASTGPGPRWGRELHALGAGAAVFAVWMAVSEPVLGWNTTDSRPG